MNRDPKLYLKDILDSIDTISSFIVEDYKRGSAEDKTINPKDTGENIFENMIINSI